MATSADIGSRPSQATVAALLRMLEELDRGDGSRLVRRLFDLVLDDGDPNESIDPPVTPALVTPGETGLK